MKEDIIEDERRLKRDGINWSIMAAAQAPDDRHKAEGKKYLVVIRPDRFGDPTYFRATDVNLRPNEPTYTWDQTLSRSIDLGDESELPEEEQTEISTYIRDSTEPGDNDDSGLPDQFPAPFVGNK